MARQPLPLGTIWGQPPAVRTGAYGMPGNLIGRIETPIGGRVIYRIESIVLTGVGDPAQIGVARAAHREMIRLAAEEAQKSRQTQFLMVGSQANANFQAHADRLAQSVGVPRSGRQIPRITGAHPDYEVTLDVAKVLAGP